MSKLFFSERGFVIPDLCEEVNANRHAIKQLDLPETKSPAQVYVLARPHRMTAPRLNIKINQKESHQVDVLGDSPAYRWYTFTVPAKELKAGTNSFILSGEGNALDAWSIALDTSVDGSEGSFLSLDGINCKNWRHKGRNNNLPGEYVLRVRLAEGQDPAPPQFIWEDQKHPRLKTLKSKIPDKIKSDLTDLERVHQLITWISSLWEYCSSANAGLYSPWDAETIISWGQSRKGQNGQLPIVMCVHYAIVYILASQSLGLKSRPAVFTENVNGFNGHFAAETWIPSLNKWIFVDPNVDAVFYKHELPLSVGELQAIKDWTSVVRFGQGYDYQIQNPAIQKFMDIYLDGRFSKHRSIWPRADFLSHPELTPPGHGSLVYCETDLVWQQGANLEMFPYSVNANYFTTAP